MKILKSNTKNLEKNGKKKENNSLMMTLKILSIEQLLNKLGTTSTKDWMKINHCGWKKRAKLLNLNTDNSTKMSSRIQATLSLGHTSKLKEVWTLLVWCIFLKELLMTNSKSFMKRKIKSSCSLEESWSMINLKTFCQNTWTLSRRLLIQTIYLWMLIDKIFNKFRFLKKLHKNFWANL